MERIKGRSALQIDAPALAERLVRAPRVLVDLGTGDGRFVHTTACADPAGIAIGVDACREQLRNVSRKAPENALFVIANAAMIPPALDGSATWLTVNFPWGSLLHGLLDGAAGTEGLARLARPGTLLEIRLNAGALAEAGWQLEAGAEHVRRLLDDAGFTGARMRWWDAAQLRACPTTWARRLAFGRDPRAVELRAYARRARDALPTGISPRSRSEPGSSSP